MFILNSCAARRKNSGKKFRILENELLTPLYRKMSGKCAPAKVRWELTRGCNLTCAHCKMVCSPSPEGELGLADIDRIMQQLKEAGAFEINLTGGEIFSRRDITEILELMFRGDFLISLVTNGTMIREEHYRLLDKHRDRISKITLSVYGGTAAVHESVTGIQGSFDRTVAAVRRMAEMDLPYAIFSMQMKANAPHHKETAAFFESNGFRYQFGALMLVREDGCMSPLDQRLDDDILDELPIPWDAYLNPEPESAPSGYTKDTPISEWCVAGRYATILPNGDLAPCALIKTPAGNLKEKSFREIWENSELLDYFRSLKAGDFECFGCEYFPRCRPCMGISKSENGSYTARPSEYCRFSKKFLKSPQT